MPSANRQSPTANRYLVCLIFACLIFVCLSGWSAPALADVETTDYDKSEVLFTRRIAPLLREKCVACHGEKADEIEGGFDVRSLEAMTAGGDSEEPGIVSGKPEASSVYLAAERGEETFSAMPPKEAEKLGEEQLAWLHEWIKSGARWPAKQRQEAIHKKYAEAWSAEDGISVETSGGLSPDWTDRKYEPAGLWAYKPVRNVFTPPSPTAIASDPLGSGRVNGETINPIDFLIEDALPKGLKVAPLASRRELIRRATFDLTGLPPTPEEVATFIEDERPDDQAFADVVERLLKSPHYGERMAQHWLDVVRYADSSGFANDYERANAWRYRDYVIRSFNNDKPYDRFVKEQIAGDEIMPDEPEGIIAAGFLRMGPWELTGMEVERVARQRFLDDVTNSVGETFLGHSLQCARCHDHKFDPVPTRDYYSIQAVFATTQLAERKAPFLDSENTNGFDEKRFVKRMQQAHVDTQTYLQVVLEENSQKWFAKRLAAAEDDEIAQVTEHKKCWDVTLAKAKKQKRANPFNFARNDFLKRGIPQDEFPPQLVGFTPHQHGIKRVAGKGLQRLRWELDRYEPYAHSVYNGHTPKLVRVHTPLRMPKDLRKGRLEASCIRSGGDPFAEGEPVTPGTLSVIGDLVSVQITSGIAGRRTKFAEWVANAKNPLTTRVIVNRIWQWHFGKAIAGNPNNFGATGGRPTHPKLLDFLASTFVEDGWSIKKMHRRIMLSKAYRRSSEHPDLEALAELDPLRTSVAVFEPRRLTAEELRDSILAVTGELNSTLGGIPCRPEINVEVAMQPRQVMGTFASAWVPHPKPEQRHRRSIYVLKLRGLLHPMLEVFNSPAPDFSCERREASTVTPQVFSLFNSQDSYSRGLALADRAWRESAEHNVGDRDVAAIRRCFDLALCRQPSGRELKVFLAHWRKLESELPGEARPSPIVPLKVEREAVEENTGERFVFEEVLFANGEFVPDLQPADVDRHVRAFGDICLVIFNSNEFVYVY
jgi:mono/diheme cytochrome c family protein